MSTVASAKLASFHASAAGAYPLFACPGNSVTLLKNIYFTNFNTVAAQVTFYIQSSDGTVGVWLWHQSAPSQTPESWTGWVVLEASDSVAVSVDMGEIGVWVSGAVLSLV